MVLSDTLSVRYMFTRLIDSPGVLRRALVEAWVVWVGREAEQVTAVGADAFDKIDKDGGGSIDAEEFKRFFSKEPEAHRLERVFTEMVVKAFPFRKEEAMVRQARLTASNPSELDAIQNEFQKLVEVLISKDLLTSFKAFSKADEANDEQPFSLAEIAGGSK